MLLCRKRHLLTKIWRFPLGFLKIKERVVKLCLLFTLSCIVEDSRDTTPAVEVVSFDGVAKFLITSQFMCFDQLSGAGLQYTTQSLAIYVTERSPKLVKGFNDWNVPHLH